MPKLTKAEAELAVLTHALAYHNDRDQEAKFRNRVTANREEILFHLQDQLGDELKTPTCHAYIDRSSAHILDADRVKALLTEEQFESCFKRVRKVAVHVKVPSLTALAEEVAQRRAV